MVGEEFLTNEGYYVKVIEYINNKNVKVVFPNGYINKFTSDSIRKGKIRNVFHKGLCHVGYLGDGIYVPSVNRKKTKAYYIWSAMIQRCYDPRIKERHSTYIGCSVDSEWHNLQNFAKWFEENYREGYQLDKDILVKGNKIYSPDTCCFVPSRIILLIINRKKDRGVYPIGVTKQKEKYLSKANKANSGTFDTPELAFNAYKIYKENLIVTIAKEYFEKDLISFDVYKSLLLYKIEITD